MRFDEQCRIEVAFRFLAVSTSDGEEGVFSDFKVEVGSIGAVGVPDGADLLAALDGLPWSGNHRVEVGIE